MRGLHAAKKRTDEGHEPSQWSEIKEKRTMVGQDESATRAVFNTFGFLSYDWRGERPKTKPKEEKP